jgi:hypothetical protein
MAATLLPSFSALDALGHWLDVSEETITDWSELNAHAVAGGFAPHAPGRLMLAVWRAQHATIMADIDVERMQIIDTHNGLWRLPYSHPENEGRREKLVEHRDLLELPHLCRQASLRGVARGNPMRQRLHALRDVRNALSHIDPLRVAELWDWLRRPTLTPRH